MQGFAQLAFPDGEFYMNTYAVELGRDMRAFKREARRQQQRVGRSRNSSPGRHSDTASSGRRRDNFISDSGGIMGYDPPSGSESASSARKTKSTRSSSQRPSRRDTNAKRGRSHNFDDAHHQQDDNSARPSPDIVPLIPLHPPVNTDGTRSWQSLSRKHIRIAFNFDSNEFEITVLGRNGAFVDEVYFSKDSTQPLVNESRIQVGKVAFTFRLPEVAAGETGAEAYERDQGDHVMGDMNSDGDNGMDSDEQARRKGGRAALDGETDPPKAKRRGPGRPPKNGVRSQREEALLARKLKDGLIPKSGGGKTKFGEERGKGKTAKSGEIKPSNLQPNGKRMYRKRDKNGAHVRPPVRESTEPTDSVAPDDPAAAAKPSKEKSKAIKPPRSPSPVFDEATLTPEQLAKPQVSYVVLIHEALSNCESKQMSLPQIYRAIERRYPFFKVRVQTQGWQSSVRHNLSQHAAFKKIERDGKGWMWGLVPEVSIEKEKKRRPTPPPQQPPPPPQSQHYYSRPQFPQYPNPYHHTALSAPTNGHMSTYAYGIPPRLPYPPALGQGPLSLPFVKPPSESTYKSPYETATPSAKEGGQTASHENGIGGNSIISPLQAPPVSQQQQPQQQSALTAQRSQVPAGPNPAPVAPVDSNQMPKAEPGEHSRSETIAKHTAFSQSDAMLSVDDDADKDEPASPNVDKKLSETSPDPASIDAKTTIRTHPIVRSEPDKHSNGANANDAKPIIAEVPQDNSAPRSTEDLGFTSTDKPEEIKEIILTANGADTAVSESKDEKEPEGKVVESTSEPRRSGRKRAHESTSTVDIDEVKGYDLKPRNAKRVVT